MKQTWGSVAVALLLVMVSTQCSKMDGPEAAAKTAFSEWAVNIRMPYRHESLETITTDGTLATVRIKVELKANGKWTQKQADVHCEKVDDHWQCDRAMKFN